MACSEVPIEIPTSGVSHSILYFRIHATSIGYSLQDIEKDTQRTLKKRFYVITELNTTAR